MTPGSSPQISTKTVDEIVNVITEAAGLDPSQIERIEWSGISPMPGESTIAWRAGSGQPEAEPSRNRHDPGGRSTDLGERRSAGSGWWRQNGQRERRIG